MIAAKSLAEQAVRRQPRFPSVGLSSRRHQSRVGGTLVVPRIRSSRPARADKRLSSTEAGVSAAPGPTSEDTAQHLSQLLEQPLALEAFITKELTVKQRQAAQRLLQTSNIDVEIPEPSTYSLRLVAFNTAIPFVGFGIMDNAIMILAGDAIDTSLGVALGISTMCAAAIGNIVSDVAGVMLGTLVEDFCARRLNLPTPVLTTAQRQLRSVRWANQAGCAIGLIIGCVIGVSSPVLSGTWNLDPATKSLTCLAFVRCFL
jgi:hypothetical protein